MKYNAVIFDLDGTLLDTLEDLADSMNAALAELNLPTHDVQAYRYFVGDGVDNLARRALPEGCRTGEMIARCIELMRSEYAGRWRNKTRPYDGVPEMLDELGRRGVSKAVLSNKPHDFTVMCVEQLLGSWSFDAVCGVDDGTPPKPDPAGALKIANALGVWPDEIIYLGDTNTDMQTAVAAGFYPVGALWGFRTAAELTESGAKTLLRHPADLIGLL